MSNERRQDYEIMSEKIKGLEVDLRVIKIILFLMLAEHGDKVKDFLQELSQILIK
jgi:hypothetical protein